MEEEVTEAVRDDVLGDLERRGRAAAASLKAAGLVLTKHLDALMEQVSEAGPASGLEKSIREMRGALALATEIEGKIADARRNERGGDGLDLEAARLEVCRRLDLRAGAG